MQTAMSAGDGGWGGGLGGGGMGGVPVGRSSRADVYIKLKFAFRIIPILDAISFRGILRASVSSYIAGAQTTMSAGWRGGAPEAKFSEPILT